MPLAWLRGVSEGIRARSGDGLANEGDYGGSCSLTQSPTPLPLLHGFAQAQVHMHAREMLLLRERKRRPLRVELIPLDEEGGASRCSECYAANHAFQGVCGGILGSYSDG